METDVDHIHVLLEYDTTERICDDRKGAQTEISILFTGTVCQCTEKRIPEKESILV